MFTATPLAPDKSLFLLHALGGLPAVITLMIVRAVAELSARREAEGRVPPARGDASKAPRGGDQALFAGRRSFHCGDTGVSFGELLVPYLCGARRIVITDKYMYSRYQIRNLRDLLAAVAAAGIDGPLTVELVTTETDSTDLWNQYKRLGDVQDFAQSVGIHFSVVFNDASEMHPRFIETDTGWVIDLDRGLDIFQPGPEGRRQDLRKARTFVINYTRVDA